MTAVLAWGKVDCEALGFDNSDTNEVTVPCQVHALGNTKVRSVSCGEKHTLICLEDGSIQSCGANDFKQCGRSTAKLKLGPVKGLQVQGVLQVATGSSHNVVLADTNKVYTWGRNDKGQLGRGDVYLRNQGIPKLVKSLAAYSVIQISCGNNHTLALTDEGKVFAWGSNNYGQLGLETSTDTYKSQPELISRLTGIPVLQVTAGGYHSFILSKSGAAYSWGRNNYGQLGLNSTEDHNKPKECWLLKDQKIKYICCGRNHTACLTKDGRLFTFGHGSFGQLGHCSSSNSITPRQVIELSGNEVSQVACGRDHTLAYVPQSGRLHAFGRGESGQLGLSSKENKSSPFSVSGPFFHNKGHHSTHFLREVNGHDSELIIKSIHAGGDQSFCVVTDPGACDPADFREHDPARQILTFSQEKWRTLQSLSTIEASAHEFSIEIGQIFSSPSCLNGSFLLQNEEHYGTCSNKHGVDMDALRAFFQDVQKIPAISELISRKIEQALIPMLKCSCQETEALRVYLMLPECHLFDQPELYSSVICPFAKSFLSLDTTSMGVFETWWPSNQPSFFKRLVMIFKQCFKYLLSVPADADGSENDIRKQGLKTSMEMLKMLYQVSEANSILNYTTFYVTELKDAVDIKAEYFKLWNAVNLLIGVEEVNYCRYPFLFDGEAKSILLQADAELQMVAAMSQNMPLNPWQYSDIVIKHFVLSVSRKNLVNDTFRNLHTIPATHFKKSLLVVFQNEAGGKGVTKEFFLLLFCEVMDPKYDMFITEDTSNLQWFNSSTSRGPDLFYMIGILCGLMIYNSVTVDLHFPLALYKKLLKKSVTLDDLKELMPTVGKSLQSLIDFQGDNFESAFGDLTFEYGASNPTELFPGGSNTVVNQSNKQDFVNHYVDYILNKSVRDQFDAFSRGVHSVCGGEILNSFNPEELRTMVEGNEDYDFSELEKNTTYDGVYYRNHPTIILFWEVFHEMSLQDKKKFLLFLTGSDRIPITGMKSMKIIIMPSTQEGEEFLPLSQTCLNLLHLPKYTTKENLKSKLLAAICTKGFHLYE